MSKETMNLQQAKDWLDGEGAPHSTYEECIAVFHIANKAGQHKTAAAAKLAACEFSLTLPMNPAAPLNLLVLNFSAADVSLGIHEAAKAEAADEAIPKPE